MDANDVLFQAAAQTIDALSFLQTHVIDEDFRAHSKATIDSVCSLKREQRSRVEQRYGPHTAPHETLAAQLVATYRGEMGSLELARNADDRSVSLVCAAMSSLTDSQCQTFKREMKQRIHEWERAFREERGVAVTAHDKAALRQVYELYKSVKNRLRDGESPRNSTSEPSVDDEMGLSKQCRGGQQPWQHGLRGSNTGDVVGERGGVAGVLQASGGTSSHPSTVGVAAFAPLSTVTSSVSVPYHGSPPPPAKNAAVSQMSDDELAVEKRHLKRILHNFENEFVQRNGHAPTKNDRRALVQEYTRYGEIKNELLQRAASMNRQDGGGSSSFVGGGEEV